MQHTLKIDGRSGCALSVIKENNSYFVIKESSSKQYSSRLLLQAKKQDEFNRIFTSDSAFYTPPIIERGTYSHNELSWIKMPYVSGERYSDFFERIGLPEIEAFIETIIHYFEFLFKFSERKQVEEFVIKDKISQLEKVLFKNTYLDQKVVSDLIYFLNARKPVSELPLGKSHGDFTLSNMLFSDKKICLVDFLDSFIESPIIDMVKLRQDTRWKWSLMLDREKSIGNLNKVHQTLDYIDNSLNAYFSKFDFYNSWYTYLEVFNLVRILPYLKNEFEIAFVLNNLKKIV